MKLHTLLKAVLFGVAEIMVIVAATITRALDSSGIESREDRPRFLW